MFREAFVWNAAVREAGLDPNSVSPFGQSVGKFPASWIRRINAMDHTKDVRYNFQGSFFAKDVRGHRQWVYEFAKSSFGEDDILRFTDAPPNYTELAGSFDKTRMPGGFRPKDHYNDVKAWASMNDEYFENLSRSKFTLAPRGDRAFSYRFYEAAATHSIPIIHKLSEDMAPTIYSNKHLYPQTLRCIGYHYYTMDDPQPFVYRKDWAEENYRLFIKYQTFMEGDNVPPGCPKFELF